MRDVHRSDLIQMGYKCTIGEKVNMLDYATWTQWQWEIVAVKGDITTLKPIKQI